MLKLRIIKTWATLIIKGLLHRQGIKSIGLLYYTMLKGGDNG